jgi:hypothetical protein
MAHPNPLAEESLLVLSEWSRPLSTPACAPSQQAQLFFPFFEAPSIGGLTMYVRTSQEPETSVETMRRVVHQIDPMLPLQDVRTSRTRSVDRS